MWTRREKPLTNSTNTAISVITEMPDISYSLLPVVEKFVLHWGEMGTRWGISRTAAQIHGLLFLSREPMNAEQIAKTLSVARSNVSTSLRELQSWRIVRSVSVLGDRTQHFEAMKDLWEMFRVIAEERKRREVDPTITVLRECVSEAKGTTSEAYAQERLSDMLEFVTTMSALYEEFSHVPPAAAKTVAKLRGRIRRLFQN
jgi:DNA-binding transcriptional regulator GbsR (MarR family)